VRITSANPVLPSPIYDFWPMRRSSLQTSRAHATVADN
jgi:hypothetical protein